VDVAFASGIGSRPTYEDWVGASPEAVVLLED
jgi:hypothetical protein